MRPCIVADCHCTDTVSNRVCPNAYGVAAAQDSDVMPHCGGTVVKNRRLIAKGYGLGAFHNRARTYHHGKITLKRRIAVVGIGHHGELRVDRRRRRDDGE